MTQSDSHKNARYSKEGALTSALVRSIMEEEKPNQIVQDSEEEHRPLLQAERHQRREGRIVRALELLEQAEARRDRRGGA